MARQEFEMRNLLLTIARVIWASLGRGSRKSERTLATVQPVVKQGQAGRGMAQKGTPLTSSFLSLGLSFPICDRDIGLDL